MGKIMNFTGTVLKNLFSKPVTINYPAEPMEYPERSRGHIEIDIDDCILCGLCSRSCPSGALTVDRAAGKWSIDRFDCVQCGYCVEKCPKSCLSIVPGYQEPLPNKTVDVFEKPVAAASAGGQAPGGAPGGGKSGAAGTDGSQASGGQGNGAASKDGTGDGAQTFGGGNFPQADLDVCVFCTLCARKCPAEAITVDRAEKKWELDRDACLSCGLCAQSCPKKCISMVD